MRIPPTRPRSVLALALAVLAPSLWSASAPARVPGPPPTASARAAAAPGTTAAPANDNLAAAQLIHSLPATISGTTVGATLEQGETESFCESGTTSSVWYSLRSSSAQRIAVKLAAAGKLDATIDVYHAVRSQLLGVSCQRTDPEGNASLSFKASKNGLYLIRVAALRNSALDAFTLEVFLPTPAVQPPGLPLPHSGTRGVVDPIQNVNAAYSFVMRTGVSYLINLANLTRGACVAGALFGPRTSSFEEGGSLLHVGCGGYRLFTPGPGQGGRYSFEVTPRARRGVQHFRLQVAPARPSETAPGLPLSNYAHAHGRLDGRGVAVLHLYRLDVTTHSNLTLRLTAPGAADFNLQLRSQSGHVIDCACGGSGSETLMHQLKPGRYYAVVSVRDATAGNFTLVRESRTITATSISFGSTKAVAGQPVGVDVRVTPAASGPVTVDIERFDPVFGWQFYREEHAFATAGSVTAPFTSPAVGRWRARASYGGSRTASPSAVGFTYLLVA